MPETHNRFVLLIADDEPSVLALLKKIFAQDAYHIITARNGEDALASTQDVKIDAALIDLRMPGMNGLELLKALRHRQPSIKTIMLTGHGGIKEAVQAIKLGAIDFLEKPFSPQRLQARVAELHRLCRLEHENQSLRAKVDFTFGFDQLVGNAPPMLKLKELIAQVGPGDAAILIQGETGTGKELVARAIHHHSPRSDKPFIPVDCAAIGETVIESELFGHVKGAFTGAHVATMGLMRSAHRGTLFLDELGELSPTIQVKLLRTVQENEVRPVGSAKRHRIDIRLVSATNRDLETDVASGRFREDLYYRLNVVGLKVPPLRERREDISLLTRYFIQRFATAFSPVRDITPAALVCLENYQWPGNVRELENVIRRAVALGKRGAIQRADLPAAISATLSQKAPSAGLPTDDSLAAYEKAAIANALAKCRNSRRQAAQLLGIGEATLYRKLNKYELK